LLLLLSFLLLCLLFLLLLLFLVLLLIGFPRPGRRRGHDCFNGPGHGHVEE